MAGLGALAAMQASFQIADQMLLGLGEEVAGCGLDVDGFAHASHRTFNLHEFLAVRVDDVNGTGDAGIEAVDGALDFQRLLGIVQCMAVHQRRLVGAGLSLGVARARRSRSTAPRPDNCRSCLSLITTQWASAPRGASMKPTPFASPGQDRRVPLLGAVHGKIAGLDVGDQVVVPGRHLIGDDLAFQRARRGAAQVENIAVSGRSSLPKRIGRQFARRLVAFGIEHQHARERADLHHLAFPARRLQPGIAVGRRRAA